MERSAAPGGARGRVPFVGREAELNALLSRLAAARAGDGGVTFIAGEAGIGKTRLVSELAERARSGGWTVLTGRAYQAESLPPYLPVADALRELIQAAPAEAVLAALGERAADIALLVRDLHRLVPLPVQPAADPPSGETDRYRLFESVTEFLLTIAHGGAATREGSGQGAPGLVLVLDDLHWADPSTLQLLLHLGRRVGSRPVLVVGTYRDTDIGRGHPLTAVLAELVRGQISDQIALGGLTEADVGRFIALTAGVAPSAELTSSVYRQTEGNPLFVVELVRLLATDGRLLAGGGAPRLSVPRSIQQVVGRRLDHLSETCDRVLSLATVIGREFSILVLEQAGDVRGDALLDALEEAEAARVITAVADAPGRYSFSHPLIRETVYGQILSSRRVRLHRRVAETVERLYAADPEPHLAELAHHWFQAAPGGDAEKAVTYARRAGDRAMALLAYEEAARQYLSGLQALALVEPDPPRQCELTLALAEAQSRAGETEKGKASFHRAADLARALGLAELQARAALGYGGYRGQPGAVDTTFIALADAALRALDGQVSSLRARLLARLAMELYFAHEFERCDRLSAEAVALARAVGDPATRAATLVGRHYATHAPDNLGERLALATELIGLAEAAGDREVALQGYYLRTIDALEAGDATLADESIEAHERIAAALRQPVYLWRSELLRATLATAEGRLAEALQLTRQAFATADAAQIANGPPVYGVQMLTLAYLTGAGLGSLEGPWRTLTERFPALVAYRGGLMLILLAQGRMEELREQLEVVAVNGFAGLVLDDNFFSGIACFADACAALDDQRHAAVLYDRARAYADRVVVINAATACRGVVAMYLGQLAATLRRWSDAEAHFRQALAIGERMGLHPYNLLTHHAHAAMLIRRDAPGDADRAAALLRELLPRARAIGMALLVERATRLLDRLGGGAAVAPAEPAAWPDGLTGREVEVLRLLAAGRTNREIADALVLSTRTVDHHIASIYRKINARRRADAAAYAERTGLTLGATPAPDR